MHACVRAFLLNVKLHIIIYFGLNIAVQHFSLWLRDEDVLFNYQSGTFFLFIFKLHHGLHSNFKQLTLKSYYAMTIMCFLCCHQHQVRTYRPPCLFGVWQKLSLFSLPPRLGHMSPVLLLLRVSPPITRRCSCTSGSGCCVGLGR